jgi:hypothetical protein
MAVPEIEIARLHGNGGGVNSDEDYLFDMAKVCVPAVTYARKCLSLCMPALTGGARLPYVYQALQLTSLRKDVVKCNA